MLGPLFRGLEKFAPSCQTYRLPILQQHLRMVKETLNLEGCQMDRTLLALWLTQWQGVLRSGDLLGSAATSSGPWDPSTRTHRGSITHEYVVEEG